jgi:hypothetical protein
MRVFNTLIPVLFGICPIFAFAQQPRKPATSSARTTTSSGWIDVTDTRWANHPVGVAMAAPDGSQVVAVLMGTGAWSSRNGGVTWTPIGGGRIQGGPSAIVFDPKDSKTFWIATCHGSGLVKTTDGGMTFIRLGSGASVDGVSVDFTDPYRRTIVTSQHEKPSGIMISYSSGLTWKEAEGRIPSYGVTNTMLLVDDKTIVTRAANTGDSPIEGVYRSGDGGHSWIKVCDRIPGSNAVITRDGAIYWQTWQSGLIKRTDLGMTWQSLSAPLKTPIVEMPDKTIVGATDKRLVTSADGGKSWTAFGPTLPIVPTGLVYDPTHRAFLIFRTQSSGATGLMYRYSQP